MKSWQLEITPSFFSIFLGMGRKWKLWRSQMETMWTCSWAPQLYRTGGQLLKNWRCYTMGWLCWQSRIQNDHKTHLQSSLRKSLQTKNFKEMSIDLIQWMVWETSRDLRNGYHPKTSTNLGALKKCLFPDNGGGIRRLSDLTYINL